MFRYVTNAFPDLVFNSCLLNYYPKSNSSMPYHSDNETHIKPKSYILTISLGSERKMYFKETSTDLNLLSVTLRHGNVLLFSKESQSKYQHGIQPSINTNTPLPRISATFRNLRDI